MKNKTKIILVVLIILIFLIVLMNSLGNDKIWYRQKNISDKTSDLLIIINIPIKIYNTNESEYNLSFKETIKLYNNTVILDSSLENIKRLLRYGYKINNVRIIIPEVSYKYLLTQYEDKDYYNKMSKSVYSNIGNFKYYSTQISISIDSIDLTKDYNENKTIRYIKNLFKIDDKMNNIKNLLKIDNNVTIKKAKETIVKFEYSGFLNLKNFIILDEKNKVNNYKYYPYGWSEAIEGIETYKNVYNTKDYNGANKREIKITEEYVDVKSETYNISENLYDLIYNKYKENGFSFFIDRVKINDLIIEKNIEH